MSPVQVATKLFHSPNDCECFFVDLRVICFGLIQSSRCKSKGALSSIRHNMRKDCPQTSLQCITGQIKWKIKIIVGQNIVRNKVFFDFFKRLITMASPFVRRATFSQFIQRLQCAGQIWQKSMVVIYQFQKRF